MSSMRKSELFQAYNAARTLARARAINTNEARVNKALGIAQRKTEPEYVTTTEDCSCPDRRYRGKICKHMIAKAYEKMQELP